MPDINSEENIRIVFDEVADFEHRDVIVGEFVNWQPIYDLYIVGDEVFVTLEIAGVDINDFVIYLKKTYMIVEGVRRSPDLLNKKYCIFHSVEIPYGRFNRRIDFPAPIEPRGNEYHIERGMLTLKFPILKEKIITVEDG